MAEASGYQKAVPCEFCDNPAKYQCQNCDDPLCTSCKEKHEKKKPHHKYVPYSQKERTICAKHNSQKYIYWCEACREACCSECVITSHHGHKMISLEKALRAKKDSVRKNLDGPYKESLTKWRTLLQEAKQMRQDYTTSIQKIDDDVVAHAARIHAAVDENLTKLRKKLQKIQISTEALLQSQEQTINDAYEKFRESINKLDDIHDDNDIRLLDCTLELDDIAALPTLTRHSPPSYNPGQINDQTMMTMIGKLTTTIPSIQKDQSRNTADVPPRPLPQSSPAPAVLSTPAVVSSFNTGYRDPYIACTTSSGLAWVKTDVTRLQLMDRHGTVIDTISTDFGFSDVTVTLSGDILFSDGSNKRIVSASKGATSWRFTTLVSTQYRPCGICCLRNGDVVVTYPWDEHRVIQYNKAGDIIHEFDQSLFTSPLRLAVNAVNDDLCVCDCDKHRVLTFGTDHSLRYQYTGSDTTSFSSEDVCTDSSGRVLIADTGNHRIHILDKDGKFIRYLQPPGLKYPLYIDVDSEGHAWIGEYRGQVKIVKYQSM